MSNLQHFSAAEYCDRLKYEFEILQSHFSASKVDVEKNKSEKQELLQLSRKYYETAYYLNIQNHKQAEINARLLNILNDVMQMIPPESQKLVQEEIESAKKVSVQDIEKRIKILQSQQREQPLDPFATEELLVGPSFSSAPASFERRPQMPEMVEANGTVPQAGLPPASSAHAESRQEIMEIDDNEKEAIPQQHSQQEVPPAPARTSPTSPSSQSTVINNNESSVPSESSTGAAPVTTTAPEQTAEDSGEPAKKKQRISPKPEEMPSSSESSGSRFNVASNEASDLLSRSPAVPKKIKQKLVFPHEHSVSSLTFGPTGERVYTGGKGCVKIWDATANKSPTKPHNEIECLKGAYIRSCKLTPDENTMIVCGETKEIVVLDIGKGTPILKKKMETEAEFHYALTLSSDSRYCFSCFSNGNVGMWDLSSGTLVRQFTGHTDSVSCIDLGNNGNSLITGGLDKTLRIWDWSTGNQVAKHTFPAQIFTLGVCPTQNSIVAVGLENSFVEVVNTAVVQESREYQLRLHESCVLSLAYAPSGGWFVTGGKDKYLNIWKGPYGPGAVRAKENNSILCCHVSPQSNLVGTGSWEKKATIYEVE